MAAPEQPAPAGDVGPSAPLPKYFRVKQTVLTQIADGSLAPGALIPSEVELCRQFAVSRTTVRKAVSDLAYEGRLVIIQGKGTFVAIPKVEERFVQRAFGIYEDMERRGITLSTQVLRQEVSRGDSGSRPSSTPPSRRGGARDRPSPARGARAYPRVHDLHPTLAVSAARPRGSSELLPVRPAS
jgi:DNA-binding transcriptional regulator YhcF (GntR family)